MHFSIRGLPCKLQNCTKINKYLTRPEGILEDLRIKTKGDEEKLKQVEQSKEGMANSECHFL